MFAIQEEEEIDGGGGRERGEQQTADSNKSRAPMLVNVNIDTRQLADEWADRCCRQRRVPAKVSSQRAGRGAPGETAAAVGWRRRRLPPILLCEGPANSAGSPTRGIAGRASAAEEGP